MKDTHTQLFLQLQKRTKEITKGLHLNLSDKRIAELSSAHILKLQELIKSFILLCHAELQIYFELICLKIIANSMAKFEGAGEIVKPLSSLLSTGITNVSMPLSFGDSPNTDSGLGNRINKFVETYKEQLSNNNGISGRSIFKMFGYLGFTKKEVGSLLIDLLNSHSSKRCKIAHSHPDINSYVYSISDERESIDSILREVSKLDSAIIKKGYLEASESFDDEVRVLTILRDKRNAF